MAVMPLLQNINRMLTSPDKGTPSVVFRWLMFLAIPTLVYTLHVGMHMFYSRFCTWSTYGSPMCTTVLHAMLKTNSVIGDIWFQGLYLILSAMSWLTSMSQQTGNPHPTTQDCWPQRPTGQAAAAAAAASATAD